MSGRDKKANGHQPTTSFTRAPPSLVNLRVQLASPKLTPVSTDASMEGGEDDEECHTPTSEESRLPVFPRICPPAPKKTRRSAPCKRRHWSSEPELIVVGTEEMEQLFRWRDQQKDDHSLAKKRRVHKTSEISS